MYPEPSLLRCDDRAQLSTDGMNAMAVHAVVHHHVSAGISPRDANDISGWFLQHNIAMMRWVLYYWNSSGAPEPPPWIGVLVLQSPVFSVMVYVMVPLTAAEICP